MRNRRTRNKRGAKAAKTPAHSLPRKTRKVIEYWQRSIVDARRMEVSPEEIEQLSVSIPYPELTSGELDKELIEILLRKSKSLDTRSPNRNATSEESRFFNRSANAFDILIVPVRFRRTERRGEFDRWSPNVITPLLVPALLRNDGKLSPPEQLSPWIPRTLLEPLPGDSGIVLGENERLEAFAHKHTVPRGSNWDAYWSYCNRFFEYVCEERPTELEIESYRSSGGPQMLFDPTVVGTDNILRLYQDILAGRRDVGAASSLAELSPPKRRPVVSSKRQLARVSTHHSGQFEPSFPLSPSQRKAVHECIKLKQGEILSVSGPPGTGKTTLIQSIVASLWVDAARNKRARPPIIVACSATNQAVTNIIYSFAKANSQPGPLADRWLPGISSYGTFCSSRTKAKEIKDIPIELIDGTGTIESLENLAYLAEAERYFLQKFSSFAFETNSLEKAVAHLHSCLKKEFSALYASISHAQYGNLLAYLQGLFKPDTEAEMKEFRATLESLDTTRRYTAFRLATHYWEGRWILETSTLPLERSRKERLRGGRTCRDWQHLAMLTPCFVSTFYMAPKFFGGKRLGSEPPVDLMIADEAGQVPTEVGAASFALAKRGLVIGDTEQLEPIWSIPEYVDEGNLVAHKFLKHGDEQQLERLNRTGLLASSGSLMKRATQVCPIEDGSTKGVFLSEHRRSVPEIVLFANMLCYRNRLEPKRPKLEKRILPVFGYAHVRGFSSRVGKSRMNRPEADTIASWLNDKKDELENWYKAPLSDIVAIITPFAAQNRYLKKLLHSKFPKMTIGTVNSLQGAERPVVLFSPVYDQSASFVYLFDKSSNMLNVAVTRAKDSFLVFGDMGIFDRKEKNPSGILARFLFARANHELVDIEPYQDPETAQSSSIDRIATLDGHREALARALREAKKEVVIVSPTISCFAIERDTIEEDIRAARARNVKVLIYTDASLDEDQNTGKTRTPASVGHQLLVKAGAQLVIADRIHNKAVALDRDEIIEGSFNWLSAVRSARAKNAKLEVSLRLRGKHVRESIQSLKQDVEARKLSQVTYDPETLAALRTQLEEENRLFKASRK